MPIFITSALAPKNAALYFLLDDKYIRGGLQTVADVTARDAILTSNRKAGMLVHCQSDSTIYQVGSDLTTWTELAVKPLSHTHDPVDVLVDSTHQFITDAERTSWTAKQDALGFTPVDAASVGANSGVASLDSSGKLTSSQLPNIAITDTFVVADQAAMLALNAQLGDVAVRTDISKSFILKDTDETQLTSWQELLTPTSVGVVSVSVTAPVENTGTAQSPVVSMASATAARDGYMTSTQVSKLDGIEASANNYVHPSGDGNLHVPATGTLNNGKVLTAGATAGSLSWTTPAATGIASLSVNAPLATSGSASPTLSIPASTSSVDGYLKAVDWVTFNSKGNGTVQTVSGNGPISVTSPSTFPSISIADATITTAGAMSASDKVKLNGIATGATAYSLPMAAAGTLGGVKVGSGLAIDGAGVLSSTATGTTNLGNTPAASTVALTSSSGTGTTLPAATTTLAGVLTAADKTKLDGISAGATNYTHPSSDGSLHVPATSTTNNGKVLTAGATAGSLSWTTLNSGTVTNVTGSGAISVATGTTTPAISIAAASTTVPGTMSAADKTKLDGIAASANNYSHPTSGVAANTYKSVTVDVNGHVTAGTNPTTLAGYGISDAASSSHNHTVDALSNVTITSKATNDLIQWNGTAWVNKTIAGAGLQPAGSYLTGNQSISYTGDATGSGTTSVALTLAASGVTAGTYNNSATAVTPITVDAKGRVTATGVAVTVTPAWASITSKPTTLAGYGITDTVSLTTHNHTVDALSNVTITSKATNDLLQWNGTAWVNKTLASAGIQPAGSYLTANQAITVSGDATGSGTTGIALTLSNTAVTPGTYGTTTTTPVISVDSKGRVTGLSTNAINWPQLDALNNVTVTAKASNDVIQWNGAAWVNRTLAAAGIQPAGSYLTANQSITVSGDVTGTGTTAITATLANSGVTAGAYGSATLIPTITVDAKGRVTSVTTNAVSGGSGTVTSVAGAGSVNGLTLTGTVTNAGSLTLGGSITSVATTGNFQMNSLGVGTVASGTAGDVRATGDVTAFYSDRRLKTVSSRIIGALDKVLTLTGVYYRGNSVAESFGYDTEKAQVGVIAQEVQSVLPEVVCPAPFDIGKHEDGTEYSLSGQNYLTVKYEKMIPLLIEAMKEQQQQIEELKRQLSSR